MSCHFLLLGIFPTQGSYPSLLRLLQKSAGSRVPASFAEPREAAASRRCHCARIQGEEAAHLETEVPAKAPAVRLPRSWEVRNRYSEEGSQTSQYVPDSLTCDSDLGSQLLHTVVLQSRVWNSLLQVLRLCYCPRIV
ncbi:hypothetical protein FD755_016730 [Muntiacus reevesi]|uniref:Uncharacterized protein n=1 Tax=Muntiacus reevesi TaxID=9886 RepID=A0A5N3XEW5_MUNRE|nr:hypothetical protein FD755_016730 [Muntiacus reevesi]